MTAEQLVEMDRLLEGLQPREALVIGPRGGPFTGRVLHAEVDRRGAALTIEMGDRGPVHCEPRDRWWVSWRSAWWSGARARVESFWDAADVPDWPLGGVRPVVVDIPVRTRAFFHLTPSNGPSLTAEAP